MLDLILAQWLAATAPAVDASLELRGVAEQRVELAISVYANVRRLQDR